MLKKDDTESWLDASLSTNGIATPIGSRLFSDIFTHNCDQYVDEAFHRKPDNLLSVEELHSDE